MSDQLSIMQRLRAARESSYVALRKDVHDTLADAGGLIASIYHLLDGKEWNADTCGEIAQYLRDAGLEVRDLGDEDA